MRVSLGLTVLSGLCSRGAWMDVVTLKVRLPVLQLRVRGGLGVRVGNG